MVEIPTQFFLSSQEVNFFAKPAFPNCLLNQSFIQKDNPLLSISDLSEHLLNLADHRFNIPFSNAFSTFSSSHIGFQSEEFESNDIYPLTHPFMTVADSVFSSLPNYNALNEFRIQSIFTNPPISVPSIDFVLTVNFKFISHLPVKSTVPKVKPLKYRLPITASFFMQISLESVIADSLHKGMPDLLAFSEVQMVEQTMGDSFSRLFEDYSGSLSTSEWFESESDLKKESWEVELQRVLRETFCQSVQSHANAVLGALLI
jgi:hypothetical protein